MSKIKINSGLASIIVLASLFAGWETLLLVALFILLFCEANDSIKKIIVKVISFYVALTLFSIVWELITDLFPLAINSFDNLIDIIEGYIDEPIDLSNLYDYLFNPINSIVSIANSIVQYLLILVKFMFVISVLTNKAIKENFITRFINKYVDKIVDFVNSIELGEINVNNPKEPSDIKKTQEKPSTNDNGSISLGVIEPVVPDEKEVETKFEEPKPTVILPNIEEIKPKLEEPTPKIIEPKLEVPAPTPFPPLEDPYKDDK